MRSRGFYIYLSVTIIVLAIFIYGIIKYYKSYNIAEISVGATPILLLSFLTFKAYHDDTGEDLI